MSYECVIVVRWYVLWNDCTHLEWNEGIITFITVKITIFPLAMSYLSVVSSYTLLRGNVAIFVLINSKRRVDLKDIKTDNVWLMHGDCLERMKEIPDGSVDMILADLPYGTTACRWDTVIPFKPLWKQYSRLVKKDGAIVLFGQEPFSSVLRCSNLSLYKYDWIWEKNKCGNFMAAKFKPLKFSENIMVFGFGAVNTKGGKGGGKTGRPHMKYLPQDVNNESRIITRNKTLPTNGINRWNKLSNREFQSNGSNYPKDIIYFSAVSTGERLHPTQKPVELLEYLIKTYTNENDTVLDNCMGSGSTGVACKNTGRKFIGIELDDNYFDIAKQRILGEQQ